MIAAVAVGQEIFIRLRCNVGWHMDWNLSTVVGCFSATAAGSFNHETGCRENRQRAGHRQHAVQRHDGADIWRWSDLRGMYAGFTSQASVTAVRLAQRGMTGIRNLFEGEAGLFNVYFKGEFERTRSSKISVPSF